MSRHTKSIFFSFFVALQAASLGACIWSQALNAQTFAKWDEGIAPVSADPNSARWDPVRRNGKYKGQSVDTDRWRFAMPLTPEQEQKARAVMTREGLGSSTGEYLGMQYFQHNDAWYYALLPANGVREVYFLTQYLGPKIPYVMPDGILGHSYLHFQLAAETPAILIPMEGEGPPILTTDFVVSSEAARPKGVKFDPVGGGLRVFGADYVSVTPFFTAESELSRTEGGAKVNAYQLNIKADQKQQVLRETMRLSYDRGYGQPYATIAGFGSENCQSSALCIVDKATGRQTNLFTSLEPTIRVLKSLPQLILRMVMNPVGTTKEFFRTIGRIPVVSPFEYYPVFSPQALWCRHLEVEAQNYMELPAINALLKQKM